MSLSTKEIAALKPREKRYSLAIENGLTLRVHPSGSKSWLVRVTLNGRNVDITLGHFPDMGLAQAKQAARRKQKEFDVKPVGGYTLKDAFVLWCNLKRGRIVSYKDEKKRIEFYLMRHLGNRQLDEITAPLVIKTVQVIERDGKQSTLKRILMRLREIMELAVCAGYIDANPLHRVSRVFAPARSTAMPSVDWRDLPAAMRVIKDAPIRMQNYFLFSLCSMLRPGEVAKLEKSWIIGDVIHIPASEMKKGRPHRVPITSLMKELLKREKMLSPHPKNKYVFAGRASNSHISKQALAKWLHASGLKGQLVAHGLRSIARCWMADNGVNFEIAEACLSHVVGDHVYRAYQRSDFLESRKTVMERWCSYVLFCAASAGIMTDFAMPAGDLAVSGTKMALC